HNGINFDVPRLQQIATELGVDIAEPNRHIDLLKVLQSMYPNMRDFHEQFGRMIGPGDAETGLGTLHEITKTVLGRSSADAHTGIDDNRNLGAIVGKIHNEIST